MPALRQILERFPVLGYSGDPGFSTPTGCRLRRRKRGERVEISGQVAGLFQLYGIAVAGELVRWCLPFTSLGRLLLGIADGVGIADACRMRQLALKHVGLRIMDFDRHGKRHGDYLEKTQTASPISARFFNGAHESWTSRRVSHPPLRVCPPKALRGFSSGLCLSLEVVKIGDCPLCVGCCLENGPFVCTKDFSPTLNIGGMIRPGLKLRHNAQISAQHC